MDNKENKIQETRASEPEKRMEWADEAENQTEISLETSLEDSEKGDKTKKRKRDFFVELILFFILGILIGIAVKTEAIKNITMGFDDYKMKIGRQDYDINKIQQELIANQLSQQEEQENSPAEQDKESGQ